MSPNVQNRRFKHVSFSNGTSGRFWGPYCGHFFRPKHHVELPPWIVDPPVENCSESVSTSLRTFSLTTEIQLQSTFYPRFIEWIGGCGKMGKMQILTFFRYLLYLLSTLLSKCNFPNPEKFKDWKCTLSRHWRRWPIFRIFHFGTHFQPSWRPLL